MMDLLSIIFAYSAVLTIASILGLLYNMVNDWRSRA